MSEDRFYSQVRSVMTDYRPEVPASAYNAMRRKLWWSNFTRLSLTRLNMWYLMLLVAAGLTWAVWKQPQASAEGLDRTNQLEVVASESSTAVEAELPTQTEAEITQKAQPNEKPLGSETSSKAFKKSNQPVKASASEMMPSEKQEATAGAAEVSAEELGTEKLETTPIHEQSIAKPASKKGLKVTTYETPEKKK